MSSGRLAKDSRARAGSCIAPNITQRTGNARRNCVFALAPRESCGASDRPREDRLLSRAASAQARVEDHRDVAHEDAAELAEDDRPAGQPDKAAPLKPPQGLQLDAE